jgi:hypothetical protein
MDKLCEEKTQSFQHESAVKDSYVLSGASASYAMSKERTQSRRKGNQQIKNMYLFSPDQEHYKNIFSTKAFNSIVRANPQIEMP